MDFKWKNALKVLEKRKQQMRRIILLSGYKTRARHQTMLSPMQICKERNILAHAVHGRLVRSRTLMVNAADMMQYHVSTPGMCPPSPEYDDENSPPAALESALLALTT